MPGPEDNPADEISGAEYLRGLAHSQLNEPTTSAELAPGPQTLEEAKCFHDGFLAGATAYAAAVEHSTLKGDNPKLRELFDAQGWRTIEAFEKLNHVCEHGVAEGEWCEPCNKAMHAARKESGDE